MPLIEVKNLVKKYKITEKEDGLIGCIYYYWSCNKNVSNVSFKNCDFKRNCR